MTRSDKTPTDQSRPGTPIVLEETGERYLPWFEDPITSYEHLHRYAYATQFVAGKRVLDLACGEGYGSYLLSLKAEHVVGMDIDEAVIKHAKGKYPGGNLEYRVGSITRVPIGDAYKFDVIVCYEAIEHIEEQEDCIREVKRLLARGGTFIVSTPDKAVYSDAAQFRNRFHVHEFYVDEFRKLLEKYFESIRLLGQRTYPGSSIWPLATAIRGDNAEYVVARTSGEFSLVDPSRKEARYIIAVASDAKEDNGLPGSTLLDVTSEVEKKLDQLRVRIRAIEGELASARQELASIRSRLAWRVMAALSRFKKAAIQRLSFGKPKDA